MRDGALDALHCGHVVVADAGGVVLACAGDPATRIYPRSALKPFQAAASLELVDVAPPELDEVAVMASSHTGSRSHQAVVRRVLDRAGLTPAALRCPRDLPADRLALRERPEPTRLAHNCSGKHAGFLLACQRGGSDPAQYLALDAPVQRGVVRWVREMCAAEPEGPGVDGCGAPAWRLSLTAVARGYARLATAGGVLGRVVTAMRTHPHLIGGQDAVDTAVMALDGSVIAKRGAEATLAIALRDRATPLGVAIKVSDGGVRALAPVAAAVLTRVGIRVPDQVARPVVLGGGRPHGALEVTSALDAALRDLA